MMSVIAVSPLDGRKHGSDGHGPSMRHHRLRYWLRAAEVFHEFAHHDSIKALFWSAAINSVVAVPLMAVIMIIAMKKRVMGAFTLPLPLWAMGWLCTAAWRLGSSSCSRPGETEREGGAMGSKDILVPVDSTAASRVRLQWY